MLTVMDQDLELYLKPTYFLDCDSKTMIDYVNSILDGTESSDIEKAIKLFYAVRDDIVYDLFGFEIMSRYMKASYILTKGSGYCVSKSIVLATAARIAGIPSRLGFADVVNHLNPGKLHELLQTDIFAFHGFAELYLEGKWVKATPSFDYKLCINSGYFVPEFDGRHDTTYPAFDKAGNRHMEYISYYGSYPDLPVEKLLDSVKKHYPHFFSDENVTVRSLVKDEGLEYRDVVREENLLWVPYQAQPAEAGSTKLSA